MLPFNKLAKNACKSVLLFIVLYKLYYVKLLLLSVNICVSICVSKNIYIHILTLIDES